MIKIYGLQRIMEKVSCSENNESCVEGDPNNMVTIYKLMKFIQIFIRENAYEKKWDVTKGCRYNSIIENIFPTFG